MGLGFNRGNVLFLILLAVALFAALSYAVTQSNRSGGNNISREKADLGAAEILQYISTVRQAVQRMKLSQGLKDWELDFSNTVIRRADGSNPNISNSGCSSSACEVFHPNGGGVSARHFEEYAIQPTPQQFIDNNWNKPGHVTFEISRVIEIGSSANDVNLRITALQPLVCERLFAKIGRSFPMQYSQAGEAAVGYTGNVVANINASDVIIFGDDFIDTVGQDIIGVLWSGNSLCDIRAVLIPR